MQIVSPKQMAFLEKQGVQQGASEKSYMERAGLELSSCIDRLSPAKQACLLVGKGNNGGDAFALGTHLLKAGWQVEAIQASKELSPLSQSYKEDFLALRGTLTHELPHEGILVDALFGTGFKGKAQEPYASLITRANQSGLPIFAIDLPSGLNGDTGAVEGEAIRAAVTLYLELPKKGFFLQEGWRHVGKLVKISFGLDPSLLALIEHDMTLLEQGLLKPLLPPIIPDRHKYQAGVVGVLAGSPGMPGAALLASKGALRSGAGLVRLLHPKGMEAELSSSPWELIKAPYTSVHDILETFEKSTAVLIGPGLGRDPKTRNLLKELLPNIHKPCLIDADALTLIAEDKLPIPQGAVLTPHIGEMMRLLPHASPKPHTTEFLHTCQHFAEKYGITLVLKGGPTFIFHPASPIRVCPFGDPGMATAGTGDVLSGVIAALLAQHSTPENSALLGTCLHGMAGEAAAQQMGSYSLIASDVVEALPHAFFHLQSNSFLGYI